MLVNLGINVKKIRMQFLSDNGLALHSLHFHE